MALALSLAEAQAQLVTVNAAIANLIAGKQITHFEIGSGNQRRVYKFWDSPTLLTELQDYRRELSETINSYSSTGPTFRTSLTIPLVVRKDLV